MHGRPERKDPAGCAIAAISLTLTVALGIGVVAAGPAAALGCADPVETLPAIDGADAAGGTVQIERDDG